MMLDINAVQEGYRRRDIANIGFVRSSMNIADCLTKVMNQAALFDLSKLGKQTHLFYQFRITRAMDNSKLIKRMSSFIHPPQG